MKYYIFILIFLIFEGCTATSLNSGGKVVRVDPKSIQDTNMDYGSEDLHIFAQKMVSSMLKEEFFDGKPVIDIRELDNKTDEHIDTKAITNTIRTAIIKSRRAKFIDSSMRSKLLDELEYQNSSKYVDKNSSKNIGKHVAPNYILDGSIMSIKKREANVVDYFYKITLNLHNIESGTIDWMEEEEVKKIKK